VTGIDRDAREVRLGTGDRLGYDRLILTMGSRSHVPEIDGFGRSGTFVLRTADDALAIRAYAQRTGARQAVVAGGGLLGLEAAYALQKLGLRTAVLERSDRLLRRQLDARASAILQAYLQGLGLEIVTQAETAAAVGNGRVEKVMLTDDRLGPADVFVVAAGIAPNVELAADAGLQTGRGIVVDDHMRTADPAVLAAGDVAEWRAEVLGLWPTAVAQAEVAADNAVGGSKAYEGVVPVTILKVVGIELASIGRFEPASAGDEVIALEEDGRYRKLVVSEGRIVGAILLGHSREVALVRTAIDERLEIGHRLDALRAGRWDVLSEVTQDRPLAAAATMV
jgi:nitrite reductase (NADH) large subunit